VVDVAQGEIWWADLPDPAGSAPGFRRPVVIVQGDHLNRSRIATVVCVPLTSNRALPASVRRLRPGEPARPGFGPGVTLRPSGVSEGVMNVA
jgi:mRNA-degrading endonuclease toxin of MazEF toxin-antitoxin module